MTIDTGRGYPRSQEHQFSGEQHNREPYQKKEYSPASLSQDDSVSINFSQTPSHPTSISADDILEPSIVFPGEHPFMQSFRDKNYREAIRLIEVAISEEPFIVDPTLYFNRGIAYLLVGQPNLAIEDLLFASKSSEIFENVDFLLGLTYQQLGDQVSAINHFLLATKHPDTQAEAAYELCKIYYVTRGIKISELEEVYALLYDTWDRDLHIAFAKFIIRNTFNRVESNTETLNELTIANELLSYLRQELESDPEAQLLLAKFDVLRYAGNLWANSRALSDATQAAINLSGIESTIQKEAATLAKLLQKFNSENFLSQTIGGYLKTCLYHLYESPNYSHPIDNYIINRTVTYTLPSSIDEPAEVIPETPNLIELYASSDDAAKLMITQAYRSVTQELLKKRKETNYQARFSWDSKYESGGMAPPLSLEYQYVGNIFMSFQQLIEQEDSDDARCYYYPIIKHVIENLMPDLLLDSANPPVWLDNLTKMNRQLGKIITDQAKKDTAPERVLSPKGSRYCMNLYYLQNAFLQSIGSHIDTFLSPDKKLLEKDKYLTFAFQKYKYRIGLKPFIVKYNELGWPESISFDSGRAGQRFLENSCKTSYRLFANRDSFFWLTTHETYLLFEHIQEKGLTYTNADGVSEQFTLIPENQKVQKEPERKDDELLDDDNDTSTTLERKRTVTSKPRTPNAKKEGSATPAKQQLIDNIFAQLESSSQDGDFLSSLSVGCIKGLGNLHKKVAEQQARIDAQCVTKVLTCAHSELLKKNGVDADKVPIYLNVEGFYQLKQYQKEALVRILGIKHKGIPGAILGLEMGLGKTLVMAELLMHLFKGESAPVLFLCPRNVMAQIVEKLREYLVIAQLGQLEEQLKQANKVSDEKRFKRIVGAVSVYLKLLDKLNINVKTVNDKIEDLEDTVRVMYSERRISTPWTPPLTDYRTGRVSQQTLNEIFNQDQSNDAGCHLLSIDPIQDIYTPKASDVLDGSLNHQRKVIVYNNDAVNSVVNSNKSKGLDQVLWAALFVDEAQNLHNIEKETYRGVKALINGISSKAGTPPFVLLSTGTPYQNYDSDPFALLSLTEPKGEFQSDSGEVFTIQRMQRLIEEKHQDVKTKMRKYLKNLNFATKQKDYAEFQLAYLQYLSLVENFKKILNDLCIIVKRDDVRDQWDGRIPEVIISDDNLVLDDRFERQKARLEQLSSTFQNDYNQEVDSANKLSSSMEAVETSGKKKKSFLEFVGQVSRTIIHPDFYGGNKALRTKLVKELADPKQKTQEEVRKWVDESILLSNLLNDDFGREMQEGSIIFVDEIVTGEAIQACIKRLYPDAEQVDFLQGSTSVKLRQEMVEKFESENPHGRQRVMIIMAQSGCAGTDLQKRGKTAHICYFDFNPGNIEQAKSRIIRANSPKDKVEIVFYNIEGLYFCDCVKRHRRRKMAMEKYFFHLQTIKGLGLAELSRVLLEVLMLECSIDTTSRTGQALSAKIAKHLTENEQTLKKAIDSSNAMERAPLRFQVATSQRSAIQAQPIAIFPPVRKENPRLSSTRKINHLETGRMSSSSSTTSSLSPSIPPRNELPSFHRKTNESDPLARLSFRKRTRTDERQRPSFSTLAALSREEGARRDAKRQREAASSTQRHPWVPQLRKRVREEEDHIQPTAGQNERTAVQRNIPSKRQKTRDFHHPQGELRTQPPHLNLSGHVEAMQVNLSGHVEGMQAFFARALLSKELISNCKIQINGTRWAIIPVERNRNCFTQGRVSGHNIIQAVACGMNLLVEDPKVVLNEVLRDLTAREQLPLEIRISIRSVERENRRLSGWLQKIHDQGRNPPRSYEQVKCYLIEKGYTLIVHRVERDLLTQKIVERRQVLVQGGDPKKEINLLESKSNGVSQFDVLTRR